MEGVSGFFFVPKSIQECVCKMQKHFFLPGQANPLLQLRIFIFTRPENVLSRNKHIVKKLVPKKIKIMQNVAKNKLKRFLKQKICRKTFFLIWTKLANCVKIRQIKIRRRKRHVFAVFCSVDHI